jgi:hypothetical protein
MVDAALAPSGDQLPMHSLLAARGGCIREAEVIELMGLEDASVVGRWRTHRQIISVRNEAGQWIYPVWQFVRKHRRIMLGIRDCLAELPFESEWEPLIFFLSGTKSLGGHNPLDCLRAGKIEAAIKAARQYSPLKRD